MQELVTLHYYSAEAMHVQTDCICGDVSCMCVRAGLNLSQLPAGRTRITLRSTGELYSHVPPSAKVHNLVLGKTWIDSFGTFHVRNVNTGVRVEMEFKPCGWFGSGQYEFEGLVLDEQVSACEPASLLASGRTPITTGVGVKGCGSPSAHLCLFSLCTCNVVHSKVLCWS